MRDFLLGEMARAIPLMVAPDRYWRREGANLLALSGAPAADLNMLLIGEAAGAERFLADGLAETRRRRLPLLVLSAVPGVAPAGMTEAGNVPLMLLRENVPVVPAGACELARVTEAGLAGRLQAAAFALPETAVIELLAASLALPDAPSVYLAAAGGVPMSSVTITRRGDTAGIWTMATPPEHQGLGVGRALLTRVIDEWRRAGVRSFYLIATSAGRRLYESLGFETVGLLSAWVSV